MLGRGTSWRQGDVLKHCDAVSLGILVEDDINNKVVVITHDCDLQSDSETNVELMFGPLKKVNKRNTRAKHPRILDLCIESPQDAKKNAIELRQSKRVTISKDKFHFAECDGNYSICTEEKQGLKQWLAARYGRPAFPNVFEERLRAFDQQRGFCFEQEVAEIIGKEAEFLIGVFFDLGEERFTDLQEGLPYELSIYLVYDAIEGAKEAREAVEKTSRELRDLFYEYYGVPTETECQLIELNLCEAIADLKFPLSALRKMDQWRLEYISLADETGGDFVGAGI